MVDVSPSPNLSPLSQQNLKAVFGGSDPTVAAMAKLIQLYLDPSFPTGPTPTERAATLSLMTMPNLLPYANRFLVETVPGDGTVYEFPNTNAGIDSGANAPVILETLVQVHSPTGNITNVNVDTNPVCDGPFGAGCALTDTPAVGLGTPDVILAGRTIASWTTGGRKPLTFHVVTDDLQPVELTLVFVVQIARTGNTP